MKATFRPGDDVRVRARCGGHDVARAQRVEPGTSKVAAVALSVLVVAAVGCVSRGFKQLDRSIEIEGVALGLLDAECRSRNAANTPGQQVSEVVITMELRNASFTPRTLAPSELSVDADGTALSPAPAETVVTVNPGAARTFMVRFQGPAVTRCEAPMSLRLNHALHVTGRPSATAAVHSIRFRARPWSH